jgi:hypothetical protein
MKILLTILFLSLLSSPSWSQTFDDLVERDDVYYKKFSDVPFSGKVTGLGNGSIKNGKREGAWIRYYSNGQLYYKGNYKNGKKEGAWIRYYSNGQLYYKGNYKNGKKEGAWISYYSNGLLISKGNYKNGKKEGAWISYLFDGSFRSGTYKDGVKISD